MFNVYDLQHSQLCIYLASVAIKSEIILCLLCWIEVVVGAYYMYCWTKGSMSSRRVATNTYVHMWNLGIVDIGFVFQYNVFSLHFQPQIARDCLAVYLERE